MSSEDEFDVNFVSNASKTVKKKWKKIDSEELKDVTNTAVGPEIPKKKKKTSFMDNEDTTTTKDLSAKSEGFEEDEDDDEVKTKVDTSSKVSLTPPGSPAASAQVKVRGAKATQKTKKALIKLQEERQRLVMTGRQAGKVWGDLEHRDMEDCQLVSSSTPQTFQLKICWRDKVERIEVAVRDRIGKVAEEFTKKVGGERGEISLYREEISVDPLPREQTLGELGISLVTVIHARTKILTAEEAEKELLKVRLRTQDKRASEVVVKIKPTDIMETLMNSYSQQTGIDRANLKFFQDGEQLESGVSAQDLDLEDGDVLDVKVLN